MFNDMNVFIIINNISVNSIGFTLYRIPGYIESYCLIFIYHIILSYYIVLSYLIFYYFILSYFLSYYLILFCITSLVLIIVFHFFL